MRAAGSPTQAEIARSTGLSRATVSTIVREQAAGGVLVTTPMPAGGRRAHAVSPAPAAGLAVGVDLLALAGDAPCRRAVADAGRHAGAGVAGSC